MLDSVKAWIVSVLIGAFILNIVNMVLPSSKIKYYINVVLNFIFIFIVISPIINFFNDGISLEDKLLKSYTKYNQEYAQSVKRLSNSTGDKSIKVGYEEGLKNVLKIKLEEYGYELEDINFNGEGISKIKLKEKDSNKSIKEDIQSTKDEEDKQVFKESSQDKSKDEIKESLVNVLDISIETIEID